jgi:hypothetical protein
MVAHTAPIVYTPNIVSWYDLRQSSGFNVSHFYEPRIEDQHIWRMECNSFCSAFPFDRACGTTEFSMLVDIDTEF